jgi:multiple sugar transport system substrate-binding protein
MENQSSNPEVFGQVPPAQTTQTQVYGGTPPPGAPVPFGAAATSSGPNEPPVSARRVPKRALLIAGAIAVVGIVAFLIIKFVVPVLTGPSEVTLTWWGLWEDENIVTPLIQEYETAHPGVKISYIKQSREDYRERLASALAQGTGPDIFRFHNSWLPMFVSRLSTAPANLFNVSDFAKNYYPVSVNDLSGSSGIVGVPLEYDAITLFINEDIFAGAGKSPPQTWDELRQTALSLTIKDDRGVVTQSGVALGRTENVDHWPEILALMMIQNRANLNRPTGELAEAALKFYTIFSRVDKVWDETLPTSTAAFASGKLAMYFGPSWRALEISGANPSLRFKTVPVPQLPKDSPDEPSISYATYWVEGVASGSKNKNAAWDFLHYMSEKQSLEKFYTNASSVRGFGEPYPKIDMANLLLDHPILGSVIQLAPEAKSWYLASRTFDGDTGINSQLAVYFENAINAVNDGTDVTSALATAAQGVSQILSQYTSSR